MTVRAKDRKLFAQTIEDPCLFATSWLGEDLWGKQVEIMRAVETHPQTFVRACHSSSKTRTAAGLALWWLAKYEEAVVITTAPGKPNLLAGLWSEIPTMARRSRYPFPPSLQLELKIDEKRIAYGYTTSVEHGNQGVRFQGAHSANVLIIVDEATGVEMPIWDAIHGIMAGGNCRLLALYNPTVASGYVHQAATSLRASCHNIKISCFDTPNLAGLTLDAVLAMSEEQLDTNVRPYLATRRWVRDQWVRYGNDFRFQSRVLGDFPDQGEGALIPIAWAERAAKEQPVNLAAGPLQVGIDVAGEGEDETVVIVKQGGAIVDMMATPQRDPRGQVAAFLRPYLPYLEVVNGDAIGLGYYFCLHLRDLGFPVQLVNVALPPLEGERDAKVLYANLKAQFYMRLRAEFEADAVANLNDETLKSQLTSLKYGQNSRGQTIIESKPDARKRGVKSPDRAEALMLAQIPRIVQNTSAWTAAPPVPMISPI